jgi:hypothetical protein
MISEVAICQSKDRNCSALKVAQTMTQSVLITGSLRRTWKYHHGFLPEWTNGGVAPWLSLTEPAEVMLRAQVRLIPALIPIKKS